MPGNDFEKQVQQKMDELSFVPSGAVWPEVEKQIAQRKRRRVLFFWLPFLVLLTGGVFLTLLTLRKPGALEIPLHKHNTATLPTNNGNNHSDTSNENAGQKNKKTMQPMLVKKNVLLRSSRQYPLANTEKLAITVAAAAATGHTTAVQQLPVNKDLVTHRHKISSGDLHLLTVKNMYTRNELQKNLLAETAAANKKKTRMPDRAHIPAGLSAITGLNGEEHQDKNVAQPPAPLQEDAPEPANAVDPVISAQSTVEDAVATNTPEQQKPADSISLAKKMKQPAKKASSKITWGLQLNVGVSGITSAFPGLFSGARSSDPNAFSSVVSTPNNSPGNGSNSSSAALVSPSAVRPGFSFLAGFFAGRQLGKHFNLVAGFNYNYIGNSNRVGAKIDSNNAMLQYKTGNQSTYHNRFHFVQIPVSIEKELGKGSRLSVNAGLAFSLLAGSNALTYDVQKTVYSLNPGSVTKFQVGLLAGARYRFFPTSMPFEIGPQFSYNPSGIFGKNVYGNGHTFFAGISGRICLSKK